MSSTGIPSPVDLPPPSARRVPRPGRGDGWDILADVEVFAFAVEPELEAMDRERVGVHRLRPHAGPEPAAAADRADLDADLGRHAVAHRRLALGRPLHGAARRLRQSGTARALVPTGQRLTLDWRLARGDAVLPSAVVVDSRSLRSAPNAWARGIDGGNLVKGIKLRVACDKRGSPLDLELHPANTD